ncbi:PREDICTED: protein RIK isoform X2 [Erythranthe guttata]|uniref:protein RIK isoform X2 n=1 Tax=Erythranthe guttata TaxID=4155 RepID=UPI00064DA5A9|nr:PREDICTED: protein RIK isoform X2 [Erythranthe guttata]|eukprot:XP_012851607.1 PREDICTED: protein RIK isoform X2 [Erythranthe guttata]
MTEDSCPRVSPSESDSSKTKQRKKRKWDQPDESLVSGIAVPGIYPVANMGSLAGITLPAVSSGASLAIPFSNSSVVPLQAVQVPLQQHAAAIVQKLIQPKIQDELIAREIVINDADSAIRYKLTKRQTQEEIQRSTGAVVITRGKYRSPNAPPDGDRPLYLHISAASHLETTAERIKAVDQAAAMVEEMLKQVDHLMKTCVFLGFEADPSFNIVSRIRGPNDQYVNHIMNETGATVLLRGRGSGYSENVKYEETQQPLHLLLSSNDAKSLEHAKLLAENLLDTISAECAASRVSSSKVYGAVPPPPQLQVGVQSPGRASETNDVASLSSSALIDGSSGLPQSSTGCYPHGLQSGTSYIGYGGIYPQATPLQQVALALRRSTSPVTATVAPATTAASTGPPQEVSDAAKYKRSQKRKFQELPAAAKGPANINQKNIQVSEFPMPRDLTSHVGARDISVVQDPKKFVKPSTNGMPPPPPRSLPPSFSAPPKFSSTTKVNGDNKGTQLSNSEVVPDTLIKLMEYGDDDDDDDDDLEETAEQPMEKHSSNPAIPKPFWAV